MKSVILSFFALGLMAISLQCSNNSEKVAEPSVDKKMEVKEKEKSIKKEEISETYDPAKLMIGDCIDVKPSGFSVGGAKPHKVKCNSKEAMSKITKITKDKSACSGRVLLGYGVGNDATYFCVDELK